MKTKHWIVVLVVGVAALATLTLSRSSIIHPKGSVLRAAAGTGVDGGHAGPCVFEAGDELAYDVRVEVDRTIRTGPLSQSGGQRPLSSSVAAELHARVLSAGAGSAVLLARYANVEFHGASQSLAAPFLLRVDASCRLQGFARHSETAPLSGRAQQAIAYELNFVAVGAGSRAELEADDSVGHYHAAFAGRTRGVELVIERSGVEYAQIWETPLTNGKVAPVEHREQVVMQGGPWLEQLSSRQVLRNAGTADVETRVEASRIEVASDALEDADSDSRHYIWENLLPRLIFPSPTRPVTGRDLALRSAVKDLTLEQAVVEHVVRSRTVANFAEVWPPLTAYLEVHPEQTKRFAQAMRTGEVPPEGRAAGWVAIGQARTPEARGVLLEVLRDPEAAAINRTRAMFALVDRADVGADVTSNLATYALDISTARTEDGRFFAREAALAMGMMAGLHRETDADVRATAASALPNLLASQHTADGLSPVFNAIANFGDTSMLTHVEPYTRHLDARVRAGAAHSFRHMPVAQLTSFLAPWLARETDLEVKRELYLTLAKNMHDRQESADHTVIDRAIVDLQAHPGVITRRALIRVLGVAARTYPAARVALMAQAKKEADLRSGLYKVVTQYLGADDLLAGLSGSGVGP